MGLLQCGKAHVPAEHDTSSPILVARYNCPPDHLSGTHARVARRHHLGAQQPHQLVRLVRRGGETQQHRPLVGRREVAHKHPQQHCGRYAKCSGGRGG